jgi:hypothetical protein
MYLGLLLALLAFSAPGFPCQAKEPPKDTAPKNMSSYRRQVDQVLMSLVENLVDDLGVGTVKRVAVLDPVGPGKNLTGFSAYVVDQLNGLLAEQTAFTLRLRREKIFNAVVERRRLYDIIVQQRIELSTHFDPKTVTPLGKKLGVDGLIFLKISEIGDSLLIGAQLVSVSGGRVIAGATVDVKNNPLIEELLKKPLVSSLLVKVEPFSPTIKVSLDGEIKEYSTGGLRYNQLPQGMHSLIVSADCHEVYRLNFYLAGHRDVEVRLEPIRATLQVTALPPEAKVKVDNIHDLELDKSGSGTIELPAGLHTVTAQAADLPPYSRRIQIGCRPFALNIDLTKSRLNLELTVNPAHSKVRLDGEAIALDNHGRWNGKVHQGAHRIEAMAEHHQAVINNYRFENDQKVVLTLPPKKYPLIIRYRPQDASLKLNGNDLKISQPGMARIEVIAGDHHLEASALGCRALQRTINVTGPTEQVIELPEKPLELEFIAVYEKDGGIFDLKPGAVLHSDQNYALAVRPSAQAYVYVYQVDGSGSVFQLFPDPKFPELKNPLAPNKWHWIPPQTHWSFLDDTVGTEKIYVVASYRPDDKLEALGTRLTQAVDSIAVKKVSRSFQKEILTRGRAGVRPSGKTKMAVKGKIFPAVRQIINACGADRIFSLEFQHR